MIGMGLNETIAELDAEHASLEIVVREALAKMRGIEVQREILQAGVRPGGDLAAYPQRTDAILAVLRSTGRSLSPSEVSSFLANGGRTKDTVKVVATTLSYLHKAGRVEKAGSKYFAG